MTFGARVCLILPLTLSLEQSFRNINGMLPFLLTATIRWKNLIRCRTSSSTSVGYLGADGRTSENPKETAMGRGVLMTKKVQDLPCWCMISLPVPSRMLAIQWYGEKTGPRGWNQYCGVMAECEKGHHPRRAEEDAWMSYELVKRPTGALSKGGRSVFWESPLSMSTSSTRHIARL